MSKVNDKKLERIISELLTFTATFCFAHVEDFWTCLEDIWIIIGNNYKLLIIFQQADIYLNEPIQIDELIKLAYQSIQ